MWFTLTYYVSCCCAGHCVYVARLMTTFTKENSLFLQRFLPKTITRLPEMADLIADPLILVYSLILACKNNHSETVKKLLDRGCNVNGVDGDGRTPLMWACLYGWMIIVIMLFSRGADVNMQDNDGWSALMLASQNGHSDVVKILIEKGAEVNMQRNGER